MLIGLFGLFAFTGLASAQIQIQDPLNAGSIGVLLTRIADGVGTIIAALGTIMIIVAGILFLISAGDPAKMTNARKAFFYAIIGIAIGITAKAIVAVVKEVLSIV